MNSFDKLKTKLAELFQLDQADLDFGIYRIMNARRNEITRFLEHDLLPQVQEAFSCYTSSDKAKREKDLAKAVEQAKELGLDPDASPKVQQLKYIVAEGSVDISALENEVYDHLYRFFNRYYDEGDFVSLRRYKEGVYAIPYEGEEVKLYWANQDQYYVKTTENFRDYAFKTADGSKVHFKIIEADTEKDNIKAVNGKDRRFFLCDDDPVGEESEELIIRFEYRQNGEKCKQDVINAETLQRITASLAASNLSTWQKRLSAKWKRADGTSTDRTVLEKHLSDYTKRNTFDYFIHKDLSKFLRREIDFYIKNEVMHLDDVEEESAPRVEQYLSKIKVIRRIAHKIIDFLAQIEDFQKKLWLKKKFVIETNYCITLDRVPEELYPEIVRNEPQVEEWRQLFIIDEITPTLFHAEGVTKEALGEGAGIQLGVAFLKAHPSLILDTRFFGQDFKDRLIIAIGNLDEETSGVIIRGENLQAIWLLGERYREQVKCIYIDPPYNTDAGPILYKNGYRHSSWLSLVGDRLQASKQCLSDDAILCITIDDAENHRLRGLTDAMLSAYELLGVVAIKNNPAGRTAQVGFSVCHEYALFYGLAEQARVGRLEHSDAQKARYKLHDENGAYEWTNFRKHGGLNTYRSARPRQFYPIYVARDQVIRIPRMTWDNGLRDWIVHEEPRPDEVVLLPIDDKGRERIWDFVAETAMRNISHFMVRQDSKGDTAIYRKWRINDEGLLPQTWWDKSIYSAVEYGTNLLTNIFGITHKFTFPKSIHAVSDCLKVCGLRNDPDCSVLDYFAGSGTTGHAVINLNREDDGNRKYILVEMADYFESVLLPRMKKVIYAKDWRDGKPVSRETGISHMFKYLRLESYEDALANIELKRTLTQQQLLDHSESFRESYLLKYMLNSESQGSPSLLNIDQFDDPFNYQLMIGTGSVGETKPVTVDLVETFNWLLGLRVKHIDTISGFRVIEGMNPKDEKVLIIWRKIRDLEETAADKIAAAREQSNMELDTFFQKQQYNTFDSEYDLIYVNGDNNLMNIPVTPEGGEPRYKVRLIEEEFKRLMFDVKDI